MTIDRRRPAPRLAAQPELAKEVSKAPAIARAAAILRLLGQNVTPLGVQAIARELGLVPSTCLHVLRALVTEDLVAFEPDTKRYSLGTGVLALAQYWVKRHRFPELAQPHLDRIGQAFDVTVVGTQITDLEEVVIVAVSQLGANIQFSTHIGTRFPALTSATGRCIAAFGGHAQAELEARFRAIQWDDPPTYADWKAQVAETRLQGFAVDHGHYISGITVVSAPVWETPAKLSHAIAAIGFSSALERKGLPELQQAIRSAAQALSHRR